jgi:hypothetical protein
MQIDVVSSWTISVQVCDAFLHFHLFRSMNTTITRRWAAQQWLNFCQTHSTTRDSSHTTLSMCWPDWTPKVEYELSTNWHWPFDVIMPLSISSPLTGKGCVFTYDAVGSYERTGYSAQGTGSALMMPVLDNQLKSPSPLLLPARVSSTNFNFKRKGSRKFELFTPLIWMYC